MPGVRRTDMALDSLRVPRTSSAIVHSTVVTNLSVVVLLAGCGALVSSWLCTYIIQAHVSYMPISAIIPMSSKLSSRLREITQSLGQQGALVGMPCLMP